MRGCSWYTINNTREEVDIVRNKQREQIQTYQFKLEGVTMQMATILDHQGQYDCILASMVANASIIYASASIW